MSQTLRLAVNPLKYNGKYRHCIPVESPFAYIYIYIDYVLYMYLSLSVIIVYVRAAMATGFLCTLVSWCMWQAPSNIKGQSTESHGKRWSWLKLKIGVEGQTKVSRVTTHNGRVSHAIHHFGGLICQPQPIIASVLFASSFLVPKFVCLLGPTVPDSNLHI